MPKIYKYILFNLLAIVIFIGCSDKKRFEYIYYDGIVFDSTGLNPLQDYKVVLSGRISAGYIQIGDAYTDKTGRFSIFGNAARSNNYKINVGRYNSAKSIRIDGVTAKQLKFDFCRRLILK